MKTVVFDIETVSFPWLELDALQREKLTRRAEDHEDFLRRKEGGALSPYTGKVIVIGMTNPETGRGFVWHEATGRREAHLAEDGLFDFVACEEPTMLSRVLGERSQVRPLRLLQRPRVRRAFPLREQRHSRSLTF